jgi:hypothetical protein
MLKYLILITDVGQKLQKFAITISSAKTINEKIKLALIPLLGQNHS